MGKFDGKRLLELGTNVASVDIVKYAKSEGAYVIVTDYLPPEKSEAKRYADETAMISTLDVDAITEFARAKKIDGIFCGVNEAHLMTVHAVAQRLGLPCYFTMEQWDLIQNKEAFKTFCEKHGVPVPQRIRLSDEPTLEELEKVHYPVIVKPVDQSGGVGIHVCRSAKELAEGYADAYKKSGSHRVIAEEYLEGTEFHANYTACDGEIMLYSISSKLMTPNGWPEIDLPGEYLCLMPSKILDEYLVKVDRPLVKAMKAIGFHNGAFFVQGIQTEKGPFIFEAGLRLTGAETYKVLRTVNGLDSVAGMTSYALTGKMDLDLSANDPTLHGKKCAYMALMCHHGTIGRIEGADAVRTLPDVIECKVLYQAGDTVPADKLLKHRYIQIYIVSDTTEALLSTVRKINETVKIWDTDGNDMRTTPLDESITADFTRKKLL